MLTRIVQTSPKLCTFLNPLIESLSKPQRQNLRELCDALLVCETEHMLAALQRLFVETTDPSNWADLLRISPWNGEAVRLVILQAQISWSMEQGQKVIKLKKSTSILTTLSCEDTHHRKLKHKWHDRVSVPTAEGETSYFVYQLDGRFTDLPMDLRVLISKRCLGQIGLTAGALDALRPAYLAHSLVAFCVSIKLSILKMLAVCSDRFLIKESCAGAII